MFVGSSERTTKASDHPSSVVPPKALLRLFPFAFPGGSLVTLVLSLIRPLLIRMFEEKKKNNYKKKQQLCSFIFAEQIKELTCNYVFFLIALQ